MASHPSVAIIGVGAMGNALRRGLERAGWAPEDLSLAVRGEERAKALTPTTTSLVTLDLLEAIEGRDVIVISVKPRDVGGVISSIAHGISDNQMILSLAAGVTTSTYQDELGEIPVVRAMPNTPAVVGEGVTGLARGAYAGEAHLKVATEVLGAVGAVRVMDESLLDAVTAVSGTGPAYVFLLAEALTEAAVREGLPRDIAEAFVHQTIRGSGHLLTDTDATPAELRSQVTSPGGTTAAAVHVLEERGFRALVEDAVQAAANRASELGRRD
jgi:pyrroline-5-carboxylate reductase